ncbi:MMPL family transporter [Desulfobacula sp.]|uniref:MMPL family transporter n=1 Tax=Desulfobacula sp. TaxID=2593537 RepID=UPI002632B6BD|nr:MMPL family transporter [Desulfobacula sp.]
MFFRFFMLGANHRFITFLFLVLITVLTGLGLPRLQVNTSFQNLIPDTHPDKPIYDRIALEFGSDNHTIVYVRDENLWSEEKVAALGELHHALEGLDFVNQVEDLFTLRSIRGSEGKINSRVILTQTPKDQAAIDQARADALYNPLIVGNILSRDGTVTALLVSLHQNDIDKRSDRQINQALEQAITPARNVFQAVFQVGPPRIHAELKAILLDDLKLLAPLSAMVLVVAILFFLRSGLAALVPLLTSGLSILWTFGMMGWTNIPLNILSAMLPSLIVVIGSTEDTHMISAYFQGVSQADKNHRRFATQFMMKHLGVPILLTVLTTALGFASNTFSSMRIIQTFAVASTFAILANGVITFLFVPMSLSLIGPTRTRIFRNKDQVVGLPGMFVRLFGFSKRCFPRSILLATAILCAFFVYQCAKLYVTNDPLSYFQKDQPLVQDTQRIHRDLAGMKTFFITLASDKEKAFQEPRNLERLVTIQTFLKKQEIFDGSISLADHLSLVNREFHRGDPTYFKIPDRRNLVAQYLMFFHRRDLERYVSHDFRRATIVVRHNVSDSSILNQYIRELKEVVATAAGEQMTAYVVGENLMINAAAENLMIAQVKSLGILLCVIFLITSIMFTSFKGGIISLIPNLIPIILMFGTMGLLKIPLNPGTAMVAVIAIGIAVDGTLHLFFRYNELCRRTSDYEGAVYTAVQEEATPMVTTSLSLALGFGILLFSNFTIIAQFGALSAATMLFSLFANLLITPLIMSRVRLVGIYQILTLKLHKAILETSPLFQGMTNYQIRKAILISELNEFEPGEVLIQQGTVGRSMYLILSGKVDVVRQTEGIKKSVATLTPGQVFGEIGYIKEIQRTADVRALTHVEMLRFDYRKLEKDLKFFPYIVAKLNFNISCILGERLADAYDVMDKHPPLLDK